MTVLLTSEARFERAPDGTVWGPPAYGRGLWGRYLAVFSSVLIAARVADVSRPSPGCARATQPDVQFWPLPAYSGFTGLLGHLPDLRSRLLEAVRHAHAIIVRVPSPVAYLTVHAAVAAGRPFATEVVGDADQVFAPGAFRHPLRGAIRQVATAAQRRSIRDAVAVLYVTSDVLQRRYPTAGHSYAASDAALSDLAFAESHQHDWDTTADFVLVTVGGLDQPYKGTSVLLEAVRVLRETHLPVKLRIVGDGKLLASLQRQSERLGLTDVVEFLGQLGVAGVRRALDSAQLFVLPSLTEGLPRALLEAMARGLPAVASRVGGIPELLPAECLVPPGDVQALAARIAELIPDSHRRGLLGDRNRAHARMHHESRHAATRRAFLCAVRDASRHGHPEVRCA